MIRCKSVRNHTRTTSGSYCPSELKYLVNIENARNLNEPDNVRRVDIIRRRPFRQLLELVVPSPVNRQPWLGMLILAFLEILADLFDNVGEELAIHVIVRFDVQLAQDRLAERVVFRVELVKPMIDIGISMTIEQVNTQIVWIDVELAKDILQQLRFPIDHAAHGICIRLQRFLNETKQMLLIHARGGMNVIVDFATVVEIAMGQLFLLLHLQILIQQLVQVKLVRQKLQATPAIGAQRAVTHGTHKMSVIIKKLKCIGPCDASDAVIVLVLDVNDTMPHFPRPIQRIGQFSRLEIRVRRLVKFTGRRVIGHVHRQLLKKITSKSTGSSLTLENGGFVSKSCLIRPHADIKSRMIRKRKIKYFGKNAGQGFVTRYLVSNSMRLKKLTSWLERADRLGSRN